MTESSDKEGWHPTDIDLDRRAEAFHEKLAELKAAILATDNLDDVFQLATQTAEASHWLWSAQQRINAPDHWAEVAAWGTIIFHAQGKGEFRYSHGEPKFVQEIGTTVQITPSRSKVILDMANSDPDAHRQLKRFCGFAIAKKPAPSSDDTIFVLDNALNEWVYSIFIEGRGVPKSKKKGDYNTKIINDAISFTVQSLVDQGLPVHKNPTKDMSTNACEVVAEISGHFLNGKFLSDTRVKAIYYESDYPQASKY